LGRNYDLLQKKDSARYYYNYYIEKNPDNEDTFNYLINLELEDKNYNNALVTIDQAIAKHPENKNFEQKKLTVYQLQKDRKKEYEYLKTLQAKNPNDDAVTQLIYQLESKLKSDRAGVNYSFTTFDRKGYGPWHLLGFQYISERQWGSLIGRINYADRLSSGQSIANGIQYEAESYFFTGKNNYSYVSAAFSNDLVFPKIRLGYSFYQNFKKGWEGDLGLRYLKTQDGTEFNTVVIGLGKYIASYWINLRTFIQKDQQEYYPAVTLTMRYYFDTRFDYVTLTSGYGSSPEERTTLGQFKERISLDSYRIGAGYYNIFNNHYIMGIQLTYNQQEYVRNLTQNELELSLMFQYKF
jgi:YaiO family outer membrane protein